ncbi:transcriptional activator FtrA [compost metagenome]
MKRVSNLSGAGRGILLYRESTQRFELSRYQPSIELSSFVKHYWIVRWDLRNQKPYNQTILAHPNVNMVLEDGAAHIYGVSRTVSNHLLSNKGAVLGVKFTSGGFYPFWNQPLEQLVNASFSATKIFGGDILTLASAINEAILASASRNLSSEDIDTEHTSWVLQLDDLLKRRAPKRDVAGERVTSIVDQIKSNPAITKVNRLANEIGANPRTLQRLFHRYIGLGPKWVIQRYRLHEAAEQMDQGIPLDWMNLAQDLGYFDQAHFIKDFKAIVGKSPVGYMNMVNTLDNQK